MALQNETQVPAEELPQWLEEPVQSFIASIPNILSALTVLVIGYMAGKIAGSIVRNLTDRSGLDRRVRDTPLGRGMGNTKRGVSHGFGKITEWFVYALAILTAASLLDIAVLSEWISRAVTYIPAFIGGLLVIILGFILADFIGDMISRTEAATRTGYTRWFASGVRMFLYFMAIVIGLDTMGVDVTILYIFARALAWGTAIGLALALGIGFGWGAKDYIGENIERWMRKARDETRRG
jgi:small-conductance mechanosensitive channel